MEMSRFAKIGHIQLRNSGKPAMLNGHPFFGIILEFTVVQSIGLAHNAINRYILITRISDVALIVA